ncbi:hypothetical protein EVAR_87162_1 [Eumeta japonica]|uniref:Uncharacterized protein n=1 Tax=Eumeta variegata TaxID=151549 RepID=A0A4C1VV21_EUMVA|nr:hypothetical protein EVAR_87162_1 [Eumeta japonica]
MRGTPQTKTDNSGKVVEVSPISQSVRPHGAQIIKSQTQDILRLRELGPRGHMVLIFFPISRERATRKILKSAGRRHSVKRSKRRLEIGESWIAFWR